MYDELVKRLREKAEAFDYDGWSETASDYEKAADAIEELQRRVKTLTRELDEANQDADYANDAATALYGALPRWIPVTELLPEEEINPNTRDFEYVLCATIWGDVRPFKYGTPIGSKDAHFWNGAGYVDAYVTHWMQLPQPPKGEA